MFQLNLQIVVENFEPPSQKEINGWINKAIQHIDYKKYFEITIRIVNAAEIQALNKKYRHKDKPTNVLSFPYDDMDDELGDIIICAEIVEKEAKEQAIRAKRHWAHMTIHGMLHLLGYDHQDDASAEEMEALETTILCECGF